MKLIKTLLLVMFLALPLTAEDRAYILEADVPTLVGVQTGYGTGFYMNGKLYTCTHVSTGEHETRIVIGDKKEKLKVFGTYLQYDVAMFEAPKGLKDLKAGKKIEIGKCEIIGLKADINDKGELSTEIVRLDGRVISRARQQFEVWACVSAQGFKQGFSGSPVLQDGKVVGMAVAGLIYGPHNLNVALIVPIQYLTVPYDAKREKEFIAGMKELEKVVQEEVEKIHKEMEEEAKEKE